MTVVLVYALVGRSLAYECVCLSVKYKKQPIVTTYYMNDQRLLSQKTMNELGTIVSEDLKWNSNIDSMIKKANSRLWLVRRTLGWDTPTKAKRTAYI